jgi:hypothetical protein
MRTAPTTMWREHGTLYERPRRYRVVRAGIARIFIKLLRSNPTPWSGT